MNLITKVGMRMKISKDLRKQIQEEVTRLELNNSLESKLEGITWYTHGCIERIQKLKNLLELGYIKI